MGDAWSIVGEGSGKTDYYKEGNKLIIKKDASKWADLKPDGEMIMNFGYSARLFERKPAPPKGTFEFLLGKQMYSHANGCVGDIHSKLTLE